MKKKAEETPELPSDVLDIITKKLDIDALFSFGGVCKNWRLFYSGLWADFMASQAPLVVQKTPHAKRACSFFSISDGRMYNTRLPYFSGFAHVGFSSGYLVMAGTHNSLLLINPFARRKIKIPGSQEQGFIIDIYDRAMLAFAVDSEEFVIVALCTWSYNLHVYQSRNSRWAIYSRWGSPCKIMDVVVFDRTLYAITDQAKIGVVRLNSPSLNFLQLEDIPFFASSNLKLVSSNDQLLVVHFKPSQHLEVYRIDFSNMNWVRLETLGDRALFLGVNTKVSALSNPGIWGLDSNCVYCIDRTSSICRVYSMNNQEIKGILLPENRDPFRSRLCNIDWCFRHLREEVDYSLHE